MNYLNLLVLATLTLVLGLAVAAVATEDGHCDFPDSLPGGGHFVVVPEGGTTCVGP